MGAVIPNLDLITGDMPAARLAAPPLDPADGSAAVGLIESTGTAESARYIGDLLRTHYYQGAAGARGGTTPQDPTNGFMIVSFTTHGGGPPHTRTCCHGQFARRFISRAVYRFPPYPNTGARWPHQTPSKLALAMTPTHRFPPYPS